MARGYIVSTKKTFTVFDGNPDGYEAMCDDLAELEDAFETQSFDTLDDLLRCINTYSNGKTIYYE